MKAASRRERLPAELSRVNFGASGVDVGASSHFVSVPENSCEQPVREFGAFTADLYRLADWLAECGVETVAMESTGVYWIPLFGVLEERGFAVMLVDPRRIKNVPGRKSDVLDCQWLQQLALQLQKCGEEFQAAPVMAAPGRCLVPPSPPGPPQH